MSIRTNTLPKVQFLGLLQILGASLFLALLSQISIPLVFTPVPLSAQTFGMMLIGALMGKTRGTLAMLLYLAEGCMGLPFFAGGYAGFLRLMGPTGGYFIGFLLQVYIAGWIWERRWLKSLSLFGGLLLSCLLQMSLGMLWLSHFVGWKFVFLEGFLPFIPGEIVKAIGVIAYLKARHEKNSDL